MPYKYDICDFVQLAVLLQLLFTYITASHLLVPPGGGDADEAGGDGGSATGLGIEGLDDNTMALLLIAVNMSAFGVILIVIGQNIYKERLERRKNEQMMLSRRLVFPDGSLPHLPDLERRGLHYHLFLSHSWHSGQDQSTHAASRTMENSPA